MALAGVMLFLSNVANAKSRIQDNVPGYNPDTASFAKRFIHRLGVEYRPGYILSWQETMPNGNLSNGVIPPI